MNRSRFHDAFVLMAKLRNRPPAKNSYNRAYFLSLRAALSFDIGLRRRGYSSTLTPKPDKNGYVVSWLPK